MRQAEIRGNDHTLAMIKPVVPVRCRVLRPENEDDFVFARMKSDHAAISPIPGPVQLSDLAGADVDCLDGQAIEPISRCVAARIVNEPLAVRRPDARVGQNASARAARDLFFRAEGLNEPRVGLGGMVALTSRLAHCDTDKNTRKKADSFHVRVCDKGGGSRVQGSKSRLSLSHLPSPPSP